MNKCPSCKSTTIIVSYDRKITCLSCGYISYDRDNLSSSKSTLKCECGMDKVYKKGCPLYFHSDYCPKYEKKKD